MIGNIHCCEFAIVDIAQIDLGERDHPMFDSNEFKDS